MFETEETISRFLLNGFNDVIADISADRIYERAPGNGHPPVWVLGHLAICAELGEVLCGGAMTHPDWMSAFGPGSSDEISDNALYSMDEFAKVIADGYPHIIAVARRTDKSVLLKPHEIGLLANTALLTIGDVLSHLLTSHFAFHLAQLSAWRRAAGHGPLF